MKKILLLILGVILFAGCVSDTQTEKQDKNTTYTPGINTEVNGDSNNGVNENDEINEEENDNLNENDNYENPTTNTITYCKVDMGEGLVQEYFFAENEVKLRTTIGNQWNEVTITPTQSCAKSSDVPGEEYCYPVTQREFDETKYGYMIGAQHMGTCN